MFIHIFKYRFRSLLRDRSMIFWTMIFPLVLATFFKLALGNLGEHEKFSIINIAVINDAGYESNLQFQQTITSLSEGEDAMFNLLLTDESTAKSSLLEGDIVGYILVGDPIKVVFTQSGINQSIIKIFLDEYSQSTSAITHIVMENPELLPQVIDASSHQSEFTQEKTASKAAPDTVLMYFYSLIAMACFFGSFFGLREVTHIQANLSEQAARLNLSPVHKLRAFLYSSASAVVILFGELMILMAYLVFILRIDFGPRIGLVIFTILVGCITGISFGAVIAAFVKGGESAKVGICIGFTNIGSFMAGMMVADIKYLIDKNLPALSLLNPINVLADSFYALYFYDTYNRYFMNIFILLGFSTVFCLMTYVALRRKKYASL